MFHLLSVEFLLNAIKGSSLQRGEGRVFSGVATDSRQDAKDKVFFALKGRNFDGHDFLGSAFERGATAFVVSRREKAQKFLMDKKTSVIHVPDTLKALQQSAKEWTKLLQTKVIAITGSCGKTTVRSFAQTLFSNKQSFASPKSYNNFIGVPLSLLSVNRRGAFLIQEIGASRPGEISFLSSLCDPVVSTVTMVGPSHLEGIGSLSAVAREKQDIYHNSPKAVWVFNRDNHWTNKMFRELAPSHSKVLTFSSHEKTADVSLCFVQEKAQSSLLKGHIGSVKSEAELSFSGNHNLTNLMCACALTLGAKIDPKEIWSLLPQCRLPEGRQEWFHVEGKNSSILFDAYNANPSSMDFFLQTCGKFSKPEQRILVLGDMRELGGDSEKYHRELAGRPAILSARFIALVGEHAGFVEEELKSRGFKGSCVSSESYNAKILDAIKLEWRAGDFIGIKASRSLKLERLLFDLTGRKVFERS